MSDSGQHPIHQAYADALAAGGPAEISVGRTVLCDNDSTDLTSDPRSGGFMFGSYAVGPCCAAEYLERIRGYGEEDHIRGYCPPGMSFADWVRQLRDEMGSHSIRITPGGPGDVR
jgi:hypothetical protein